MVHLLLSNGADNNYSDKACRSGYITCNYGADTNLCKKITPFFFFLLGKTEMLAFYNEGTSIDIEVEIKVL